MANHKRITQQYFYTQLSYDPRIPKDNNLLIHQLRYRVDDRSQIHRINERRSGAQLSNPEVEALTEFLKRANATAPPLPGFRHQS